MASRKRNEFLDIDESDNDQSDNGYDSEAAEESKTRASKRRKILDSDNNHSDLEDDDDNDVAASADEQDESARNDDNNDYQESSKTPKEKPLKKQLKVKPPKKNKTGVVYLSSLPPYLKPMALKTLLVQRGFGPITKVFLTPAVHSTSGSGRRNNKRKTYSDGWVEFESKKTAKICAETLNANIVGGKKGGWYHDDIWNMKYLRGFKWADLMEQVQRERSEREARQRIEDMRARKEDKVFLSGVEKGKVIEGIRKKREEKKKAKPNDGDNDANAADDLQIRRVFRQNEVKQRKEDENIGTIGADAKRVLGKIF
ncbi:Pre-rRNA-processing protein esf2 [Talaromyces pinophilus]|nr:Pre-rRNA-processing protein esf2 [Talaromyces pinophilus]